MFDVGWNFGFIWELSKFRKKSRKKKKIMLYDVGWNVGFIWELSKFKKKIKKKKVMLDDAGWNLLSIKLFIRHFLVYPTIFSCWMHVSSFSSIILPFSTAMSAKHLQWSIFRTLRWVFFHNRNTKESVFKHRQLQARQCKKKPELTTWKIVLVSKSATSIRNISLKLVRSSILNSFIILLKYPWSLLLFTHRLVFPLWDFSSWESVSSFKMVTCASACMSIILNFRIMNGL